MRSCLLLSHQYFAIMCIPDAADRLWLSSETQINSNRAISPSLGISARGRISLRSLAWLSARAVPGNGLATLSGFYGARSMGGGGQCIAGQRSKSCFATVRLEICELKSPRVSWGGCKRGFTTCEGQKLLPVHHPAARAPAAPARAMPLLPCLQTPTPASALSLSPDGPLAPHCIAVLPTGGHSAVWLAISFPCAVGFVWSWPRVGWCGQGRGWGQEPAASPPAAGAGCLSQGGWELTGDWGQLYPLTLPRSLLAGAARASCT